MSRRLAARMREVWRPLMSQLRATAQVAAAAERGAGDGAFGTGVTAVYQPLQGRTPTGGNASTSSPAAAAAATRRTHNTHVASASGSGDYGGKTGTRWTQSWERIEGFTQRNKQHPHGASDKTSITGRDLQASLSQFGMAVSNSEGSFRCISSVRACVCVCVCVLLCFCFTGNDVDGVGYGTVRKRLRKSLRKTRCSLNRNPGLFCPPQLCCLF